jgi:hypothetical protein
MGGGGGSSGTTTQQSNSEAGPPSFLKPYLQQGIWDLNWEYDHNKYNVPGYYPGELVAPLSTQSQGAVNAATNLAGGNPATSAGVDSLTRFLRGDYTNPTTNPDYLKALQVSHQPYIDQFNKDVLPGITSTFSGAGRYGSGAMADTIDRATTNLNRTISDSDAKAGSDYYSTALQQMLQANGLVPGLSGALWQNVGGLGAAGQTVDQNRQAQDAAEQAKYNYNSNKQMNYIAQYLAMLNGGYPGGTNTGTTTGQSTQPTGDNTGQIIGGVASLAGTAAMFL